MMLAAVVAVVVAVLTAALVRRRQWWPVNIRPAARGFPTVNGHWLLGVANDPGVVECFDTGQRRLLDVHNTDTLVMRVLLIPMLITRDPALIRHVLVSNSDNYAKPRGVLSGYQELGPFLGSGLLLAEGPVWKHHRKIVNPAFAPAYLRGLVPIFDKVTDQLVATLRAATHAVHDLQVLFTRTTIDVIGEAGFGTTFDAMNNEESVLTRAVSVSLLELEKRLRNPLHIYLDRAGKKQFDDSVALLHGVIRKVIEQKRQDGTAAEDKSILGYLMRAQLNAAATGDNDASDQYTDQGIIDEIMTFFLAGHETTATAMTWAFRLLLSHPTAMGKLAREVDDAMPTSGAPLTFDAIQALPYLDAVLKETLRLYPPISIGRCALQDDVIVGSAGGSGGVILKGAMVGIAIGGLHRNRKVWGDNADDFVPERWFADNIGVVASTGYMPFALGQRNCIGMQFAQLEMKVVMARLVREFAFFYVGGQETLRPVQHLTVRPLGGCLVRVTDRALLDRS